jgi:plastocyanin
MSTAEKAGQPVKQTSSQRLTVILVVVVIVVVVGGVLFVRNQLDVGDPVAGVTEVAVRDNSFGPESVQISAGTTITWIWDGKERHNVVGDDFESPVQTEGTFNQTFAAPGSYDYECTLHFFMRGRVVVTE